MARQNHADTMEVWKRLLDSTDEEAAEYPELKPARVSSAHESSRSTAPYPSAATGSAPGVQTTRAGSAGTAASTPSRPDVRTGTPGKARPSSSAVRPAPVTDARIRRSPQTSQA